MLRGIFFDLDDTLITSSDALNHAMGETAQLAQSFYPHVTGSLLLEAMVSSYHQYFSFGTPGYQQLSTIPTVELRSKLTTLSLERLKITPDPSLISALQTCYTQAETSSLTVFPDVEFTLKSLKPDYLLGIITNGPSRLQHEKLNQLRLSQWFDLIIVDTDYGKPKPDPDLFLYAASQANLKNDELMFVGNSLDADVHGANGAGWCSVYLSSENSSEADYTIAHLIELLHIPLVQENLRLATRANLADTI